MGDSDIVLTAIVVFVVCQFVLGIDLLGMAGDWVAAQVSDSLIFW